MNTRVVRRSNALLGWRYGRDFRYRETWSFGAGAARCDQGCGHDRWVAAFAAGVVLRPTRRVLKRYVLPKPGEGPSRASREAGFFTMTLVRSRGDAELFKSLLAAYRRAPEVTRRRIYLETMQAVYPNVKQKIILDKDLQGVLPLLPLTGGR